MDAPDIDIPDSRASDIHTPVMLERCVELLAPALGADGAVLVDATVGMGGHAHAFLERFPGLNLVGLDRDGDALAVAAKRLHEFGGRVHLVHTVYDEMRQAIRSLGFGSVDGVLFDLGVSSLQLDRAERGFSYAHDAPLDMRMDQTSDLTAEKILAEYSEDELRRIFWSYGEERLAARYAGRIVRARQNEPFTRSAQLVRVIADATPAAASRSGHPAKRVFQALRIEVNQELAVLERAIPVALASLTVGGRIAVLAFQSLEDRIVKQALRRATTSSAPEGLPVELPEHLPRFRLLVRGAEQSSQKEKSENPRAISVRLRAAERVLAESSAAQAPAQKTRADRSEV